MNALTENYFDTLSAVLDAVEARLADARCVVQNPHYLRQEAFPSGVPYGATVAEHLELVEYKGKPTRKAAHATVYRLESGRYELTFYVL